MSIPLTLRTIKGSKLTFNELDSNFLALRSAILSVEASDTFVTGGTYNPATIELDFTGNDGFTPFSVDVSTLVGGANYWTAGTAGNFSVAQRTDTSTDATGTYSVAINRRTRASGLGSFAGGRDSVASGSYGFAFGVGVSATTNSVAFGTGTLASGTSSFANGTNSVASGLYSTASGYYNTASGYASYAEGSETTASGAYSHAEGSSTVSSYYGSHAEGGFTTASGLYAHAEGHGNVASGSASHAEGGGGPSLGSGNIASGDASHVEGGYVPAGIPSINQPTSATTYSSHAEGIGTLASGRASHAEGELTRATNNGSHAEGRETTASGLYSHAEGYGSTASAYVSHAEGYFTTSSGGYGSHSEGNGSLASGEAAHAEGNNTVASGPASHAEGGNTTASGLNSHAGGLNSIASGTHSFVHSSNSLVNSDRSVVLGGQNLTGSTDDTVYVPFLNINNLGTGTSINNLGIDSNGFVVTGAAGGGGGGTFTGNTSATCINELWVSNISGCSPVTIGTELVINDNTDINGRLTITSSGSNTSDTAFLVKDSAGNHIIEGLDTGQVHVGDLVNSASPSNPTLMIGAGKTPNDRGSLAFTSGGIGIGGDNNGSYDFLLFQLAGGASSGNRWHFYNGSQFGWVLNDRQTNSWGTKATARTTISTARSYGMDFKLDTNNVGTVGETCGFRFSSKETTAPGANDVERFVIENGALETKAYFDNTSVLGVGTPNPNTGYTLHVSGKGALISGTGQNMLTVIGSGATEPLFTVQGSSGELFSITDDLTGSLFAVNDISGLPILEVFDDDTVHMGSYQAPSLNTTVKLNPGTGLSTVYSLPVSAYTGAFFDYTVSNTTGARAGNIMSIFSGSTVEFTETATSDIGSTTPITFTMSSDGSNASLQVSAATTGWEVKTIVRSI